MAEAQAEVVEQRWQDWMNLVLGGWLILAPLIGLGVSDDVAAWNSYGSGAVVVLLCIAAITRAYVWEEWASLAIGLWLVVAPFLLGYTHLAGPMWNQVIVGLVVGLDALWGITQMHGEHRHA